MEPQENIGPIFVEDGHLTNMEEEKAEAFNVLFFSFSFSL